MMVSDFDYYLPEHLIAQEPAARRDLSGLLVVDRASGNLSDSQFNRLPEFLRSGDLLVVNNTRVFPARLIGNRVRADDRGKKITGARVEIFLVRQKDESVWESLVKPGRALPAGARVEFSDDLGAEVIESFDGGRRLVRFHCQGDFDRIIDRIGRTPLPPYIKRGDETRRDRDRYQTVYARERGAIAAPTAGLHFTEELINRLRAKGVEIAEITLHVGYGTFQPVRVERVEDHRVEPERYTISEDAARLINQALKEGRRVIAVGTTTTRALESAVRLRDEEMKKSPPHLFTTISATTDLFIYPGFEFRAVSGMVTNFHLPRSSLVMLVAAFAGRELTMKAYRHAVEAEYRFYSYGDAMLIL
jgi:S-adenosylmethionine:tRNA ribosyltransferase-isomerase